MQPVIAVIDIGKTNKKLFLFDEEYNIVYEQSARFTETVDEDGDACENLDRLRQSILESLQAAAHGLAFDLKAVNFSTYGASFVYVNENGTPLTPLYNYLKAYPPALLDRFYAQYGGREEFSLRTASPALGSLNAGLQVYRLKHEKPAVFRQVKHALHLPQYASFLLSGRFCSDLTSIGCHTGLWDFDAETYHAWVRDEGVEPKLAPVVAYDETFPATVAQKDVLVGPGLHDSSAALIPYLVSFQEPFVLLSTGTWCITLNPFNQTPLTVEELSLDCLRYLQYNGKPVKASRLFAGAQHEEGVKCIAEHFKADPLAYRTVDFSAETAKALQKAQRRETEAVIGKNVFLQRSLSSFSTYSEAYHQLLIDIIEQQVASTNLVLRGSPARRLFVDGGFSKNPVFMNLLAAAFPHLEVYAASMAQATAVGAALAVHKAWNRKPVPNSLIKLQYYAVPHAADSETAVAGKPA